MKHPSAIRRQRELIHSEPTRPVSEMPDEAMDPWAKTIFDLMEAQRPVVDRASAYMPVKVEREAKSGSAEYESGRRTSF